MLVGPWYSRYEKRLVEDRIVLCLIDLRLGSGLASAPRCMLALKEVIARIYRDCAGAEEEIWITAQPIFRHG